MTYGNCICGMCSKRIFRHVQVFWLSFCAFSVLELQGFGIMICKHVESIICGIW